MRNCADKRRWGASFGEAPFQASSVLFFKNMIQYSHRVRISGSFAHRPEGMAGVWQSQTAKRPGWFRPYCDTIFAQGVNIWEFRLPVKQRDRHSAYAEPQNVPVGSGLIVIQYSHRVRISGSFACRSNGDRHSAYAEPQNVPVGSDFMVQYSRKTGICNHLPQCNHRR